MNKLSSLRNLRKEVGVIIEIGGETFKVLPLTAQANSSLYLEAKAEAAASLVSVDSLKKQKLSKAEAEEFRGQFGEVLTELPGLSLTTKYDQELIMQTIILLGKKRLAEMLRDTNGEKLYENAEERAELIDLIETIPGAQEAINQAIQEVEKKTLNSPPNTQG